MANRTTKALAAAALVLGMAGTALALDGDGDGIDDAVDPCNNIAPTSVENVTISVAKLLTPGGDDVLRFKGTLTNVPGMDPIAPSRNGFRILFTDSTGATALDIFVPPGGYTGSVGWKSISSGSLYKNDGKVAPLVNGITGVKIRRANSDFGRIKFSVTGKTGNYAIDTANLPIKGTVILAPPLATNGQCGETAATCVTTGSGNILRCR